MERKVAPPSLLSGLSLGNGLKHEFVTLLFLSLFEIGEKAKPRQILYSKHHIIKVWVERTYASKRSNVFIARKGHNNCFQYLLQCLSSSFKCPIDVLFGEKKNSAAQYHEV